MAFRIICGPAGSGKTSEAVKAFRKALGDGLTPYLVTPSGPDKRHFQRRLLEDLAVVTGGAVMTFDDLCRDLLRRAGFSLEMIGAGEKLELIRALTSRLADDLLVLRRPLRREGFITALVSLLSELESAGVDPAGLGSKLSGWAGENDWRRGLTADLFRICDEYRGSLAQLGVTDVELARLQAVRFAGDKPELVSDRVIIFHGFKDFTPEQHAFLKAAGVAAAETLVTLPCSREGAAFAEQRRHLELLEDAAGAVEWLSPGAGSSHGPLAHIADNLFEEGAAKIGSGGRVLLMSGAGDRGQAEQVAAETLRLWRSGTKLDDIAVVCRSAGSDMLAVADALDGFGVPWDMPVPIPLSRTPLGRTVIAALDFACADGGRPALLGYLRGGFPVAPDDLVDRFERRVRLKAVSTDDGLLETWEAAGGRRLVEMERLREAASAGAKQLCEELCSLARDLLGGWMNDRLPGRGAGGAGLAVASLRELIAVCNGISRFESIDPGPEEKAGGDASRTADSLKHGLGAAQVRLPGGLRRGCVRLLDPHRVLNQKFDVIFVCGLLEKRFPRTAREDPFFSDADRRALSRDHGLPLTDHSGTLDEEKFLFHRTLTRARDKVYLCHPYCDKEGKPTIPSLFISYVLELFDDDPEHVRRSIGDVAFAAREAPTPDQALRSLAVHGADTGDFGRALAVAKAVRLGEELADRIDRAEPRTPLIAGRDIRDRLSGLDAFGVTELERYLRCPFGYFIERLVRPSAIGPEAFALRRGNIAHDILCRFNRRMSMADIVLHKVDDPQVREARREMQQIVAEVFEGLEQGLETAILRAQLGYHLDRYVVRESECRRRSFEPFDFEVSFGREAGRDDKERGCGGSRSEAAMLQLEGVKLHGRIDRIDIEGEGGTMRGKGVVIDYKTSRKVKSHKRFEKEGIIQLPLYMEALRRIFGIEPMGGEHYSLLGQDRRGVYLKGYEDRLDAVQCGNTTDFVDEEVFNGVIEKAREMAGAAIEGIRAGEFPCLPLDGDKTCGWCDHAGICRKDWLRKGDSGDG